MTDEQLQGLFSGLERFFAKRLDEVDAKINKLDARADSTNTRIDKLDLRIDETNAKIEKVETTLLTEFHKWASPTDAKLRTHRALFHEVDAEFELLKLRVTKLEQKQSGTDPAQ